MPLSPPCSAQSQEWSHAEPCTRSASRGLTAKGTHRLEAEGTLGTGAACISHYCVTRDPEAPAGDRHSLAQSVGQEPTQATVGLSWKRLISHAPWRLVLCSWPSWDLG